VKGTIQAVIRIQYIELNHHLISFETTASYNHHSN